MKGADRQPKWRDMDAQTRAIEYSPSSALDGPIDPFIQAYRTKSEAAYTACPDLVTVQYDYRDTNTIDLIVPAKDQPSPLHIFIHGGYWQELSKRESFFPAPDSLSQGIAFAAVDYTLCPRASVEDIAEECCTAIARLFLDTKALGIDPNNIVLSGSSAGAHLAALACTKLPEEFMPAGLVLLSGIFELEPLLGTYINDAVGMDLAMAKRASPVLNDVSLLPKTLIAWGENETDEFKRQSRHFEDLLRAAGRAVESLEIQNRNHFDIVEDLTNTSVLGAKVTALITGQGNQNA